MKTLTAEEAAACLMQLRGGRENSRRSNPVSVAVRRRIEELELQLQVKAIMECNAPELRPKFELKPRERSPGVELPEKVVNPCHITKLSRHKPFRVGHRYWGLSASSVKVSFLVADRRRGRHGEEIMEAVMFGDRRSVKLTPTSMYETADTPAEWVRRGWVLEGVLCSCDIVRHNETGVAKLLKPAPKPKQRSANEKGD